MRLLVTRPAMDAAALADLLAAQGHDVLISPMIHIELNAVQLPDATAHSGLALTSANGVRALMAHLAQLPNAQRDAQMAAWAARPAFAVGPQTAAALQAAGFQNIHQADGDVDALIDLIVADYEADDAVDDEVDLPLLHIAGRDRAGDLVAGLKAQNIACGRAVLYRAEAAAGFSPAAKAALGDAQEPVEGVVIYSQRSADIFCALYAALADELAQREAAIAPPTAFCLSGAIAAQMRAAGFEAFAPPRPDSAALLALLSPNR